MRRLCGEAGTRDSAAEYCEMASSCRWASIATSPKRSSFPQHRDFVSERRCHIGIGHICDHVQKIHLACSPSGPSANSLSISQKHSMASITRSIVSRQSHMAQYTMDLGTLNWNGNIHATVHANREIYSLRKQLSGHLSMTHLSILLLPTASSLSRSSTRTMDRSLRPNVLFDKSDHAS